MHNNEGSGNVYHNTHNTHIHVGKVDNLAFGPNYGHTNQSSTSTPAKPPNQGDWLPRDHEAGRTAAGLFSLLGIIHDFVSYMLGQIADNQQPWTADGEEVNFSMGTMDDRAGHPSHWRTSHLPPYQIYVHTLLAEGHGLPCWKPAPSDPAAQPKGVVPGDVGMYTAEGGFRRVFNLFEDVDIIHNIPQTILAQANPREPHRSPSQNVVTHQGALSKGEVIIEGAFARKLPCSPHSTDPTYEFHRPPRAPAGAILVPASSADKEETDDIDAMKKYIYRHAEAIYRHAISMRPIGEKESLYIVTGCVKTDSWAMAAYRQGHGGSLRLVPILQPSVGGPPQYEWMEQGSSRVHAGWSHQRNVKDQSLFLLGFKLAFAPHFRSQVEASTSGSDASNCPGSGTQGGGDHHDQPRTPPRGPPSDDDLERGSGNGQTPGQAGQSGHHRCVVFSGIPKPLSLSRDLETTCTNDAHDMSCRPSPHKSQTSDVEDPSQVYHPSDAINAFLIQRTGCDIAICHDDSWRFLLKSCHSLLIDDEDVLTLSVEDLSMKIGESGSRTICTEGGVAFLLPDGYEAEQGKRTSTFKEVDIASTIAREGSCSRKPNEAVAEKSTPEIGEAHGEQQKGKPHVDSYRKEAPQPPLCAPDTAPSSNCFKAFSGQDSPLLRTDIIVLVMGLVGAGRSTFINALLPEDTKQVMDVGTSLAACTTTANCVILDSDDLAPILGSKPSYRLVLVDTPGFDSGYTSDSEGVLKEIVVWAGKWLPGGQKRRGGVILMHDLTADRLQGQRDLVAVSNIFTARSASDQIVGVTSKWRNVPNISGPLPEGDRRHRIVQQEIKHVTFHKFREEVTDAREIMKCFLPSIEQGSELDFGKAFEEMKSRKVKEESSYKKKMRRFLNRLVGFFRSLWRTADAP